jgi:glycosyltransferase involved in cell wall biosynthesis
MNKIPFSMCIIVKNDPLLEDCLKSIRPFVGEIVIVDTGSDDGITQAIAKKYADKFEIFTDCNGKDPNDLENFGKITDFSMARNRAFELASEGNWVGWADADDVIEGLQNLPAIMNFWNDQNKTPGMEASFLFPYEYSFDANGHCTCEHYRERVFTNKNSITWINPIHEVGISKDISKMTLITREEIRWRHRRQYSSKVPEAGRNLRIIKKYLEKMGETDARQLYYAGLEYANVGQLDDAIKYLTRYTEISGWYDEIVMAALKLVDIYTMLQDYKTGLKWAMHGISLKPHWGEPFFAAARMFYFLAIKGGYDEMENWERVVHFGKLGLDCPPTKTLLFVNHLDRECEIHKYLNMAYNKLGRVKEALDSVNTGMKKEPNDPHFVNNKRLYESFIYRNDATVAINYLKNMGEVDDRQYAGLIALLNKQEIPQLVKAQEIEIRKEQEVYVEPVRKMDGLDIVFAVGQGVENWTPETVKKTGIGGSELMCIELTKRLARLGHRVRVYNSCGSEGKYEGVEYYQTEKYNNLTCDVLVVSRNAQFLDDQFNINTKLKLLWIHDIFALNATNRLLLKADRILALSEWHRQNLINYHSVSPDQVIKTRNGIDLNRFKNRNIKRDKFKCINSSSPDRSWPVLLNCWPEIKRQVPKASLHLFYGFTNWKYAAQFQPGHNELIARLEQQIRDMRNLDVIFHDRVDQQILADEFLSSGVWIFPSWFDETFCISSVEAQAAGCRMITSNKAALKETVGERGVLIDGEWTSQEYQKKFIDKTVEALNKNDGSDRPALQRYAEEHFGLDALASDWEKMFVELIETIKTNPISSYYPTVNYR